MTSLVKCGFSFLVVVGIVVGPHATRIFSVGFENDVEVGTRVLMLLPWEVMTAIYVPKQLAHCRNEYFTW